MAEILPKNVCVTWLFQFLFYTHHNQLLDNSQFFILDSHHWLLIDLFGELQLEERWLLHWLSELLCSHEAKRIYWFHHKRSMSYFLKLNINVLLPYCAFNVCNIPNCCLLLLGVYNISSPCTKMGCFLLSLPLLSSGLQYGHWLADRFQPHYFSHRYLLGTPRYFSIFLQSDSQR